MISKRVASLLTCALSLPALTVLPASAAGKSSTAAKVTSSPKPADFVGSWSCSTSITKSDPGGRGKMVLSTKDELVTKDDGKGRSNGTMQVKLVMHKGDQVAELNASWSTGAIYSWRLEDKKSCYTYSEVNLKPLNDDARTMEKLIGKPIGDTLPLGREMCAEVVKSSRDEYTVRDPNNGSLGTCKRK